jgi:phosphomevalonate kinase
MKVTVSAPGKVLVLGGYLVLEAPNPGLVLTTSARFYCTTTDHTPDPSAHGPSNAITVYFHSPQFATSEIYAYDLSTHRLAPQHNVFVASALEATFSLLVPRFPRPALVPLTLSTTVVADNDFYSQRQQLALRGLPPTTAGLRQLPPFTNPLDVPPHVHAPDTPLKISKTGLGSSAALTVSLVASVYRALHLSYNQPIPADWLDQVHTTAQYAHSIAQGKIGSGFDVASAVWGSIVYTRFTPERLTSSSASLDHVAEKLTVPENWVLVCGDCCGGSHTPSMVSTVLQWKKQSSDAQTLWNDIATLNREVIGGLVAGRGSQPQVKQQLKQIRTYMKRMGVQAGVPIEPDAQTRLLDKTFELGGVVAVGVPGAGGYDAIYALCEGEEAAGRVEQLWADWKDPQGDALQVCALTLRHDPRGVTVEQEEEQ